jgi:hypothetical protein
MIRFTTFKDDTYELLYNAEAIGENTSSNWSRDLKISSIKYRRNNEPFKLLKFIFIYGDGCVRLIEHGKGPCEYSMSYIALDDDMNYVGHYFEKQGGKQRKIAQHMGMQLVYLLEEHKTSTLPFFVYFLESIADPIMRLIYMFTYMPSICLKSGK